MTKRLYPAVAVVLQVAACNQPMGPPGIGEPPCSQGWFEAVEARIPTSDGMGHGPDIGSDEWKSVVEFNLGVRGQPEIPARNTDEWCQYIDALVAASRK